MSDGAVQIKVDATKALAKFSPSGIPDAVRRNLRQIIPGLTKQLGASVEAKLSSDLKSRKTLTVKKEMVENPREIIGRVTITSPSAKGLLPTYLELGTRAHDIHGNPYLAFFWEKLNQNVVFRSVHHPGTKAYAFLGRSFAEMQGQIVPAVTRAVKDGAKQA